MKTLFLALSVLALISCSRSSRTSRESFPDYGTRDEDWISYEGVLPSKDGSQVLVTLQLMPGPPGMDSYFRLNETLGVPGERNIPMGMINSKGKYSVLLGPGGDHLIHITRRRLSGSLMIGRVYHSSDQIAEDLFLKGDNDRLRLVNSNFEPINPEYTLFRRSDLFTVEGYVTVYNDTTAEFYERNTHKNWPVAPLARYDEAATKYRLRAKEKFEGIYVKALSYSVAQLNSDGEHVDALVFKKILSMDDPGREN